MHLGVAVGLGGAATVRTTVLVDECESPNAYATPPTSTTSAAPTAIHSIGRRRFVTVGPSTSDGALSIVCIDCSSRRRRASLTPFTLTRDARCTARYGGCRGADVVR